MKKRYKVYAFDMYSKYGVYSKVKDVNKARLEETRQLYIGKGYTCTEIRLTPFISHESDYNEIYTPLR